jgi:UDP-N-acetylmuramate--alanine ligase
MANTNVTGIEAHTQPARPRGPFTGKHIYLIGIGGCGMSGLARLLADHGAICAGSDSVPSDLTESLIQGGINVSYDQAAGVLPEICDLIVASAAITPDHPELLAAQHRDIPVLSYAEMLGRVQALHTGISIAGTHGKSTTSAMLCHVLIECGLDPSFIVGANCSQIGGGSRTGGEVIPTGSLTGKPGILIAEACEFNRSFHHHRPTLALINNVEEDHLDIYGSLDNVVKAFAEFAQLIPPSEGDERSGYLLIAHEDAHRREITASLPCTVETFGYNPAADYQVFADPAAMRVGVLQQGHWLAQWSLAMPGEHNAMNSAAAAILAHRLGADWDAISEALSTFKGIDRRMQRLGTRRIGHGEVTVYDDYGHHPTEIEKTLKALRAAELGHTNTNGRLICVFQPHQHSRTRFLMEQFAKSFSSADIVIVPHIYFVRDSEIEKQKVSAADLVDNLRSRGVTAMHLYPFEAIVEQLDIICRPDDLLVIMGAGPVWKVARQYLADQR